MNHSNSVTLTGVLSRAPHPAGKVTFASIRIAEHEGRSPIIDVKAFAPQAEELAALNQGDAVTLIAHLSPEEDKKTPVPKGQRAKWYLYVVVDEIRTEAKHDAQAVEDDGFGF